MKIRIKCATCGEEKFIIFQDINTIMTLVKFDKKAKCCKQPNYHYHTEHDKLQIGKE